LSKKETALLELIHALRAARVVLVAWRPIVSSFFLIAGVFGVFNVGAVVAEIQGANLSSPVCAR
jgi:transmembrane protein